jgi:ubiquitin C-terminal hydrolase
VKNFENLRNSLDSLYMSYEVISDYNCDSCGKKVDIHRHNKIKALPVILSIPLNRFEFNYEKFEREKINDYFAYPLELDMKSYIDQDELVNNQETEYELNAVVVHRGTPFSGHFFSYIRDVNAEGNWNLEEIKELRKQPSVIEVKPKEEETGDIDNKEANEKGNNNKTGGKGKGKKGKKNNQKVDKDDEEYQKFNFDECEYPIEYTNKELSKGWFCFDDTSIFPIRLGRLIKQFKSSESAYVLFYIKKGVQLSKCSLSSYLQDCK